MEDSRQSIDQSHIIDSSLQDQSVNILRNNTNRGGEIEINY